MHGWCDGRAHPPAGLSDRLTARLGAKVMVAGGLLIGAIRALLLSGSGSGSGSGADTGFGLIAAADSVRGLGLGLAVVTAEDATLGAVPAAETGAGLALVRTAQFTAMSFGVAILGSVLSAAYRAGLAAHLAGLPAPARAAAEGGVAGAARVAPHGSPRPGTPPRPAWPASGSSAPSWWRWRRSWPRYSCPPASRRRS